MATRKDKWKRKNTLLRKTLHDFFLEPTRVSYGQFFIVPREHRTFCVINGGTENTIATMRFTRDNKIIVRYRPNSYYSYLFSEASLSKRTSAKIVSVPSSNLGRGIATTRGQFHGRGGDPDRNVLDYAIESLQVQDEDRYISDSLLAQMNDRYDLTSAASFMISPPTVMESQAGSGLWQRYGTTHGNLEWSENDIQA